MHPMTYPEFKQEVTKLINDSSPYNEGIKKLLVKFLYPTTSCHGKEDLLTRLTKINQACEDVPTRGQSNDELVGQASRTLSDLMKECDSLDEWFTLVRSLNKRLIRAPGATVDVFGLFRLIEKSKLTQH
jgi:hypothetical protein